MLRGKIKAINVNIRKKIYLKLIIDFHYQKLKKKRENLTQSEGNKAIENGIQWNKKQTKNPMKPVR